MTAVMRRSYNLICALRMKKKQGKTEATPTKKSEKGAKKTGQKRTNGDMVYGYTCEKSNASY